MVVMGFLLSDKERKKSCDIVRIFVAASISPLALKFAPLKEVNT
jgi:hypothetical protein